MPPERPPTVSGAYDQLADEYAEEVEASAYNADLAFPGTVAVVPDVDGKRVLDAGCGTGVYAEWLLDRGADVVGIDASEAMLAKARERVGDRAELRQWDLADPLSFADDGEFDGVVSVLVLSYLADWEAVFEEFARVLAPGGFVVVTVAHPFDEFHDAGDRGNYFEIERGVKDWSVEVPYYRRPLSAMIEPILDAGLRIDAVSEPQPTEEFREKMPERYEKESRYPVFLCVRATNE